MIWLSSYNPEWQRKFALFPVETAEKKVVWLGYYWIRYLETDACETCGLSSWVRGHWEIRINKDV